MKRDEIFQKICEERDRQDALHPMGYKYLLHPAEDPMPEAIDISARFAREDNDRMARTAEESAFGIVREEVLEFFAETDKDKRIDEAIQNAALWVRIIERETR